MSNIASSIEESTNPTKSGHQRTLQAPLAMRVSPCTPPSRPMNIRQLITVISAAFVSSAAFSAACISVDYPPIAFRCNPSLGGDACPDGFKCCSDDPAAFDTALNTSVGVLPQYGNLPSDRTGQPMFSEVNNVISRTGMCVSEDSVISLLAADGDGLFQPPTVGCPRPCNPTWSESDVLSVCGVNNVGQTNLCCQTVELDVTDCVFDGDLDCFRPVSGLDLNVGPNTPPAVLNRVDSSGAIIVGSSVSWFPGDHATMQGPGGDACTIFAGTNDQNAVYWYECARALSVANQRGYCLTRNDEGGVATCPLDSASYVDACEQLNLDNNKSC